VQVTKEERGNKGAALTTYLSLAGRYCVLMPNTDRGGGISRRITSVNDRKRLKSIIDELDAPDGMAVIVRTAGMERCQAGDPARLRLPAAAVGRDPRSDAEIVRAGADLRGSQPDQAFDPRSLYPRHRRHHRRGRGIVPRRARLHAHPDAQPCARVQPYRDQSQPLFQRYQIESQIAAIHEPVVHLRSGGYIVLNQTEALVAIDVNSGRATRERNIEETALRTNVEGGGGSRPPAAAARPRRASSSSTSSTWRRTATTRRSSAASRKR
jgi:ribonuclease E